MPTRAELKLEQQAVEEFNRRAELIMDEDDVIKHATRDAGLKTMEFFWRGLRLLAQYKGNRNMALDCFILALGKGEMIGCQSAVEIAVRHFGNAKKKAAVNKIVVMFRDCLAIENMPGQRTGREHMTEARKKQLTKGK